MRHACRLQEVNKTWKESPFIHDNRDALSGEVCDLLDLIFVVDPRKRITVPESLYDVLCFFREKCASPCLTLSCCRYWPMHHTLWVGHADKQGLCLNSGTCTVLPM